MTQEEWEHTDNGKRTSLQDWAKKRKWRKVRRERHEGGRGIEMGD